MQYFYLLIAVVFEVSGTMLLPVSQNFTRLMPTAALIGCYSASFYFLKLALNNMPIAVVYATWSGMGIFCISVLSFYFLNQSLSWQVILGMALIVSGVTLVNLYAKMPH